MGIKEHFYFCGFLYSELTRNLNLWGSTFPFPSERLTKAYDVIPSALLRMTEGVQSLDEDETYFFGIIDILQNYNLKKKTEAIWKRGSFIAKKKSAASCVSPKEYKERFFSFMAQQLFETRQGLERIS